MNANVPRLEIKALSGYRAEHIMVSRLSEYLAEHQNLVFPHRHSFYHLVLFTEGAGAHTIDFDRFEVQPFQIYFMIPGQIHSWDFEGEMEGFVVNFSDAFFHSFLLKPDYLETFSFFDGDASHAVLLLEGAVCDKVLSLFGDLIQLGPADAAMSGDLAKVLVLNIFLQIEQQVSAEHAGKPRTHKHHVVQDFQKLVEKHFTEMKLPGEYAPLLHVTPNHLNALCREHLGIQAGQLIRNRVVLEAKRLLVSQDLTVSQIAYRLNFSDNSYFVKFFKKETGSTPDQFRSGAAGMYARSSGS